MRQQKFPLTLLCCQQYISIYFLTSILLFLFIFSSCMIEDLSTDPETDKIKIKGSGNVISKDIEVPYFNSIFMNTAGLVTIAHGTEQNVTIIVDDNVLEYLNIHVQNDALVIEVVDDIALSDYDLTVDVNMTDLESLTTNSAGSIRGLTTFEESQINLILNSAGNIYLDIKANHVNSVCNSAGNLFLSGQVTDHDVMLSSAGNLFAFGLLTDTTSIILNSAGNAQVFALKLLNVTINSVGSVFYKGDPVIIQHINSMGRVFSAN